MAEGDIPGDKLKGVNPSVEESGKMQAGETPVIDSYGGFTTVKKKDRFGEGPSPVDPDSPFARVPEEDKVSSRR